LAVFSLAAGLGAVADGVIGPRLGYARTATVSILTATLPLATMLLVKPGPVTLLGAAAAGLLLYASQPLLIVAAQNAVPQAPAAAAGWSSAWPPPSPGCSTSAPVSSRRCWASPQPWRSTSPSSSRPRTSPVTPSKPCDRTGPRRGQAAVARTGA
jgi:hypothetical protein